MAKKTLFLIPRNSMDEEQRNYYSRLYPEVMFELSDSYDPIPLVRQKLQEGIEIVAGRGNTAETIRRSFPKIHVVEIQVTGYDVIRSLEKIDLAGATVAIITNNVDISGLSIFEQLYSFRIIGYLKVPFNKMENTIRNAVLQGAQYIIGGALTCRMVNEMGVPARAIPLSIGPECMSNAIHDIRQVQEAIEVEEERQGFLNRLLDSINEGVISVDLTNRITLVNSNAARTLQISPHLAIGKMIDDVFPQCPNDKNDALLTINGNKVLVTRTPVIHAKRQYGAIYTLHETSRIESLETHIRREAYESKNYLARYHFEDLVGESKALKEAIRIGKSYAQTDSCVLISGETGSGKEMFAQSIHNASSRKNGAFVAVNCAALPETLLESELFGYVEGAFTGANRKGRAGLFEAAHGGTIFLDEISETSYACQGRLLRVLQEKYIVRLGNQKIIPVDVRVIAATNKNLKELVKQGKFREDLYYRLNVLNLHIPPIREREQDALILLKHFLKQANSNFSISNDAAELINRYPWRGNVREISNLAARIIATVTTSTISRKDIEQRLDWYEFIPEQSAQPPPLVPEENQKEEIRRAIKQANGNMGKAAAILGIDRSTLWRRMKKLGMKG